MIFVLNVLLIVEIQVRKKNICPLCRGDIKESFKFELDKEYDQKILKLSPEESLQIKKQLKQLEKEHIKISIVYGNTHKLLSNPLKTKSGNDYRHEWTVFFKCPKD